MNTPNSAPRRHHTASFKAQIIQAATQPDTSVTDIARAHGLHPELVRRWIRNHAALLSPSAPSHPQFVPIQLAPPPPDPLRIEIQRGGTLIKIDCPAHLASACADMLKGWLA